MLRFIIRRLSLIGVTLLVVSLAIFLVTEVLPGDVATMILRQGATEQNLAVVRRDLGLNRPAHERYLSWVGSAIRGDLGDSYKQKRPITEVVRPRLSNSAILAVFAFLVAVPAAVIIGVWTGVRRDTWGDRAISIGSLVAISLPEFVTAVLLIVIFSSTLGVLPSSSIILPGTSPLTRPEILVLPALTLTGVLFAYIMRMTRANVIEVMQSNYTRTAILKGLPMRRVLFRHVVPNAMLPTISVIAANIGWMLGGLIIVENVFAYPGLGRLVLEATQSRDVPLLQSVTLLIAATFAFSNLAADLCYAALNPRIRYA
ncbi:MAG: ABC transporter permease [SAR202 cluster bacterium]|jgi:peptide/nickel transport system permease protein|nr:ABC transporter permease [SAR202 cluster bacterium]HJN87277.1 ABC transporter permease [Dehalococcoidia bacterium]